MDTGSVSIRTPFKNNVDIDVITLINETKSLIIPCEAVTVCSEG